MDDDRDLRKPSNPPQAFPDQSKIEVGHINVRESIAFLLLKIITIDIITAVFVVFFLFLDLDTNIAEELGIPLAWTILLFVFIALGKIILTIYVVMEWLSDYYEITKDHILHKNGLIMQKQDRLAFDDVETIKFSQGWLGKILNYGTITLYNWRDQKYTNLYLIHNPIRYLRIIEALAPRADEDVKMVRTKLVEHEDDQD